MTLACRPATLDPMPMTLAEARAMTIAILDEHYAYNWSVKADRAISRMGQTRYKEREIGISQIHLDHSTREAIINTILHECAHAIVGPHSGHGIAWRRTFIALGGNGARVSQANDAQIAVKREKAANPLWVAHCPTCNKNVGGFNRKPSRTYSHTVCRTNIVLTKTR